MPPQPKGSVELPEPRVASRPLLARQLPKLVGRWNTWLPVVKGWNVEHWLNGRNVIAFDLGSAEGKAAIAKSTFNGKGPEKFASLAKGHIALRDHGNVVCCRSRTIRELK